MMFSAGYIFDVTGPLWGMPQVTGGLPSQKSVMQSFDVFLSAPKQTVAQTIEMPVI